MFKANYFNKLSKWFKEANTYLPFLLGLFLFWAVVPTFAKLGNLNGIQKTFWINWFAIPPLLVLALITRKTRRYRRYPKLKLKSLPSIVLLGLVWPFIYSVAYFESVNQGSPALTTIIGRTNILVYAPVLIFLLKKKSGFRPKDIVLMTVSVLAVAISLFKGVRWELVTTLSVILAFVSAFTTGIYIALGEAWKDKYNPILLTLIIEVVTAIGASIWILLSKSFVIPTGPTLWYLLFIGIFANGVAFWLYLEGLQRASRLKSSSHKVIFMIVQTGVLTFAQVLIVSLTGAEAITPAMWIGIGILVSGMVWYGLSKR